MNLRHCKKIPAAQLNIVINEELGLETAKYLKERYGTPYVVAGIPYGLKGTLRWLEKNCRSITQ